MDTTPTPKALRAAAADALRAPGRRRLAALAKLDQLDTELRPLVIAAVTAEVPYRMITELTGLSHTTAIKWAKQAADDASAA